MEKIKELISGMKRAIYYLGRTEEPTPRWSDGYPGTHRQTIQANSAFTLEEAIQTLQLHFRLEWLRIVWSEAIGKFECRFVAEPKDYRKATQPPEIAQGAGPLSPFHLACALRQKLSVDPRLIGKCADLQIVITDSQGNGAQLWLHENSNFWQAEEGVECEALAERLNGTFAPNAERHPFALPAPDSSK